MPITQGYSPAFEPGDIDTMELDFAPDLNTGELISNPVVQATGGFTITNPLIGVINSDGLFASDANGRIVQVVATAIGPVGVYPVTFTVSTSYNRLLHRTVNAPIDLRS